MVAVRRRDEEPSVCVRREGGRAAAELERGRGAMVRVFCVGWQGVGLLVVFFATTSGGGRPGAEISRWIWYMTNFWVGRRAKFHMGPGTN